MKMSESGRFLLPLRKNNLFMKTSLEPIQWNVSEYVSLIEILSLFPSHLYMLGFQQDGRDTDVLFTAETVKWVHHFPLTNCYCEHDEKNPCIVLQKGKADGKENVYSMVHDLVHKYTNISIDLLEKELLQLLKMSNFQDIQRRFMGELMVKYSMDSFSVIGYHSHLGLGVKNKKEFFSVAAEYYIEGKQQFIHAYKDFLGEKDAVVLYEFLKERIFGGKEIAFKKHNICPGSDTSDTPVRFVI